VPPHAGELFDFDFEVEPILEVLVGKVLEQGLMEVLEEEELSAMRSHQEHFEQVRNAELVATQRMEAAEQRKAEEKERRLAQVRCARCEANQSPVGAGFACLFVGDMTNIGWMGCCAVRGRMCRCSRMRMND
jgi:hypothetical protein